MNPDIAQLKRDIEDLQQKVANPRIQFDRDIHGLFETVSAVPTGVPISPYDQIKFYSNSTTYRLYMYDRTNHVWRYTTLT